MTGRQKLYLNTGTSLLYQIVALVCGFILPRYILSYFGSDANGLVTSITRFLSVISFLELGVGPVIQSNLYKPLADGDTETTSKIVSSAQKFYRRISYIFLGYIAILFFVLPNLNGEFVFWYTSSLLFIISVSTFAQYYFDITYQVALNADHKVYVQISLQIITIILNTALSVILMRLGFSIHVVKLVSAIVYIIRPLMLGIYVRKHYLLDTKIKYTVELIKQKWNGFAQHLAAVVCEEIDVVLLTMFSTYQNVSIYSVYFLVVSRITNFVMASVAGLKSLWGNMLARGEKALLLSTFKKLEMLAYTGVTLLFVTTAVLIAPFVSVYTAGIKDTQAYYLPAFGAMFAFDYAAQCLRVSYFRMIKAAGHYKEAQNGAFISMGLNIILSVILVFRFNLIGGAIGTIVAMLYHTIYFAGYLRGNILKRPFRRFVKHMILDVAVGAIAIVAAGVIPMSISGYLSWLIYAIEIFLLCAVVTILVNVLFYQEETKAAVNWIKEKVMNRFIFKSRGVLEGKEYLAGVSCRCAYAR